MNLKVDWLVFKTYAKKNFNQNNDLDYYTDSSQSGNHYRLYPGLFKITKLKILVDTSVNSNNVLILRVPEFH